MKRLVIKLMVLSLVLVTAIACSGGNPFNEISDEPLDTATAIPPPIEHSISIEPTTTTEPTTTAIVEIIESTVIESTVVEETDAPLPMVALTFDDGPSLHTEGILDTLERYNAKATFFVLGSRLSEHRSIVERASNLGMEIANHSYTHSRFTQLTDNQIINEIQSASAAITAITGVAPLIYRPPFGATNDRILTLSAELGYGIVKWTLDPVDWRERDAAIIYYRIMSQVEDGSVIVLHDIHATTAQAMELVVPSLIKQGFQLVTVSELLCYRYGGLEAGNVFGSDCAIRLWD